jgi:muramoyltetrapeptide carboxypeptidase LdcA involved in peptidoglycan recycling
MIKPNQLKEGDTIAILSPSWGGPSVFPHIYESGLSHLRQMGFNIIEYPTARMDAAELHKNPRLRAEDINNAFEDSSIQGIISTIGGNDSVRILKYLDMEILKSNPKFIMGYSDFTTINTWLNINGLVSFNGPSVMAGFSQFNSFSGNYRNYVTDYLLSPQEQLVIPDFPDYTDGYPDWMDKNNTGKVNTLQKSDGPHSLQGSGRFSGRLFGGCMEVLQMMKGTDFWPAEGFWKNRILFFETSEEKPSVDYVKYWLRNYGVMGIFDEISGILFGRARDYSDKEKEVLDQTILSVVRDEFGKPDLPLVSNLDFGHTDPQIILPLGINFEVDMEKKEIVQTESAFS